MTKVKIDSKKIQAVIFDLNGTIINDIPFHIDAWLAFFSRRKMRLTRNYFYEKMNGRTGRDILRAILGKHLTLESMDKLHEQKQWLYRKFYRPHVKSVPGFENLIKELKKKGIEAAIATSTTRANVRFVSKKLKLIKTINVIVSGESATRGKPAPDIYLLTARKLKIKPQECLVFEDAPSGVESAQRAGMKVIGVVPSGQPDFLPKSVKKIKNFRQVEVI